MLGKDLGNLVVDSVLNAKSIDRLMLFALNGGGLEPFLSPGLKPGLRVATGVREG